MTRLLLCLILTAPRIMAQEATVFESSLSDGLLCIDKNDIPTSVNFLRRGINCYGLEKASGDSDLGAKVSRLIADELSHPKRAAYLVYAAVIEMTNKPVDFDRAIGLLNDAQIEDPALPEIYNTRGVVYFSQRKIDSALVDYSKAIDLNP